jgi:CheY-like chemotaxis protein
VIADLAMPGEDGFQFIQCVRQFPGRVQLVPAIALSACPQSQETALGAGFTAFLAKPARPRTLIRLAGTLLGIPRLSEET